VDLRTTYVGLALEHPLVASAGPLSENLDGVRRLEDGGAAAIVLFSLFEEQIRHGNAMLAQLMEAGAESCPEGLSYFPTPKEYAIGPDAYLDLIRRARETVGVPVFASLNAVTSSGWADYARLMEQAGASALELNIFHLPADVTLAARDVEARYVEVVRAVRTTVRIPIAVKLPPFFSAPGEMARRLHEAGADGLVLFNRFYQPDLDIDRLEVVPSLELSTRADMRLPLLWIAILHGRVPVSLGASSGLETGRDAAKYLLAGADVAMTTSALLRHGPGHLRSLLEQLRSWMESRRYESVRQLKGSMSQRHVSDPGAFERANYIRVLRSYRPREGAAPPPARS
jgi:dihydroorotate dehydrogenase (fumarate)